MGLRSLFEDLLSPPLTMSLPCCVRLATADDIVYSFTRQWMTDNVLRGMTPVVLLVISGFACERKGSCRARKAATGYSSGALPELYIASNMVLEANGSVDAHVEFQIHDVRGAGEHTKYRVKDTAPPLLTTLRYSEAGGNNSWPIFLTKYLINIGR